MIKSVCVEDLNMCDKTSNGGSNSNQNGNKGGKPEHRSYEINTSINEHHTDRTTSSEPVPHKPPKQ